MREKQKTCLITSGLSENMPFFLQNSFLAIRMLISGKLMQTGWSKEEELVKNAIFRSGSPVVTKGLTLSSMF